MPGPDLMHNSNKNEHLENTLASASEKMFKWNITKISHYCRKKKYDLKSHTQQSYCTPSLLWPANICEIQIALNLNII